MNNQKLSVSPLIYNNGNRKLTLKINDREVFLMVNNPFINEEFKKLIVSDETITNYFLIALLHNIYKNDKPKEHKHYLIDEWQAYNDLINDNAFYKTKGNKELKASLLSTFKDIISDDLIDEVTEDYLDLSNNEGKNLIYSLSRLLYLQDKYKDDEIGQQIDAKIKEWLEYIRIVATDKEKYNGDKFNSLSNEEKDAFLLRVDAYILYDLIKSLNNDIANTNKHNTFMSFINQYDIENDEATAFLFKNLDRLLGDANSFNKYKNKINHFLDRIEIDINTKNFFNDKEYSKKVHELVVKYHIPQDDSEPTISDDEYMKYDDELGLLFKEYLKDNEVKIQDKDDVKKWRDKADNFINHLTNYKGDTNKEIFTIDYTLNHLAYNDYQREAYKLNIDDLVKETSEEIEKTPKKKRLSNKQLIEKYQEETQLKGEVLNPSKNWALVDTSKTNNKILNIREMIGKKVDSNVEITQRKINALRKKTRPTKDDIKEISELEELKQEQLKKQQNISDELSDLKDDLALIDKQIMDEQDEKARKELLKRRKGIDKQVTEKQKLLNNEGVFFQMNTDGQLTYETKDPKTKERYKLLINSDYDIQNFNQEGRNFLQYIPNIDNIVNELDKDYITVDINDYVSFHGTSNPSRTRQRLLKTLTEMRKESYEYSFVDENGVLKEGSLVLIGDVMTEEYNGKNTLTVQLGGQYKRNIQQAIIKGQIAHVNKEVFKLGHGIKNTTEYRAKELYLYFVRLARSEARKGLINGKYEKTLKISTIIDYLREINAISYNPYRYNETVKEPLQVALYMGQELGLYEVKTDAFKYYDDVIATNNNGANVKDKISNFENQLIKITISNDNTDLASNEKAHKTYEAHKKKKTTKK